MSSRLVQYDTWTEGHLKDGEPNSCITGASTGLNSTAETMSAQFSKGPTFGLSADVRNKVCAFYNTNAIILEASIQCFS